MLGTSTIVRLFSKSFFSYNLFQYVFTTFVKWNLLTQCGLVMSYGDIELGQHWLQWSSLIINEACWQLSEGNSTGTILDITYYTAFKMVYLKILWHLPVTNELKCQNWSRIKLKLTASGRFWPSSDQYVSHCFPSGPVLQKCLPQQKNW